MQSLDEKLVRELRSELISHKKWKRARHLVRTLSCQFDWTRSELCRSEPRRSRGSEAQRMAQLVRWFVSDPNFWQFCSYHNIYPLHLWEFAVNTILDHDELKKVGGECDAAGEEAG